MALHTTTRYDEELNELKTHVLSMGERVQAAIDRAAEVVFKRDRSTAQHTIEQDSAVNALELACDEMSRNLIVRRQPAGSDLRFVIACNKIVTDLERMGDLAAGICRSALRIGNHPVPDLGEMPALIEQVRRQVAKVLGAYAHEDVHQALEAIGDDAEIDALNTRIYHSLIDQMGKDPALISAAIVMTNIAKNLERIGDLAVSVAQMVVYMASGQDIRHIAPELAAPLIDRKK
jgi:phosphate transport system protein